jgi:hypothetical protein
MSDPKNEVIQDEELQDADTTVHEEDVDLQVLLRNPKVDAFIKSLRKQEKDKLYPEITRRDAAIKELQDKLEGALNMMHTKEEENITEQKSLLEIIQNLKQGQDELKVQMQRDKEEMEKEKHLAMLDAYRERRIREVTDAGHGIILELIAGDSPEEIDASIEKAMATYSQVAERERQAVMRQLEESQKGKGSVFFPVTNPAHQPSEEVTAKTIRDVSDADWGKVREEVKRKLGLKA